MEDAVAQLLEAWQTNNRIDLFLIDKISDEGMGCSRQCGHNIDKASQYAIWNWDKM